MKSEASPYALALSTSIALLGALLFLSILSFLSLELFASTALEIFSRAGSFLFESFLWGAFYVPLYLFCSAFLLVKRPFERNGLIVLTVSIPPFLSVSALLKVLTEREPLVSPLTLLVTESIGRIPGAILIGLVTSIEILLVAQLVVFLSRRGAASIPTDAESVDSGSDPTEDPKGRISPHPWRATERDGASVEPEVGTKAASTLSEANRVLSETTDRIANNPVEWESLRRDETPWAEFDRAETPSAVLEDAGVEPAEPVETVAAAATAGSSAPTSSLKVIAKDQRRRRYTVPVDGILGDYEDLNYWKIDDETRASGEILMSTLKEFNISAELTGIQKGPVITMFEILPSPGVKLSRIVNLADNIALRLAALRVRIVAPIPGKHAVGIEVPNKERVIVPFKEMIALDKFQKSRYQIPIVLGKDISGGAQIVDLVQTPHLLIAGATGSGKSVCVNCLIASILYRKSPEEVRILLIDPKIVELKAYNDIPHLMTPVITDPKRSFQALQYCIYEMERRYSLLESLDVRDIHSYNRKIERERLATTPMPYIVIFIDEFADLMATTGKEMESTLARLAAMSRAVGLHLVLATQRPSVDVITGLIKANIPSRIAFMVASKFDSRIIIDTVGSEKLLGQGDMLFTSAWDPAPIRIQGAYLSDEEINAITTHVKTLGEPDYLDAEIFFDEEGEDYIDDGEDDPLMDKALDVIITAGKASASYLQRRLKIGYNRAARLIERMEMQGIVGPANGSKPRDIIHIPERN